MSIACGHAERLISLQLDGELEPAERDLLRGHLDECARCRGALETWARDGLLAADLLRAGIPRVDSGAAMIQRQRPRSRPAPRSWRFALMAAAVVAAVIGAWLAHARTPPDRLETVVAEVRSISGTAQVERGGRMITPTPGSPLFVRDRILVAAGSSLELAYPDASTVLLGATAIAALAGDERGKELDLSAGTLAAAVAHQPDGRPMRVLTADAICTVVGTRFTVALASAGTRLAVTEGRVRLTRRADEASLEVPAARAATTAGSAALALEPETEAGWHDLARGSDLSAWTTAKGSWTLVDGELLGEGLTTGGRIDTRADFADGEVAFRIRALPASGTKRFAEVMLGGGAWQFPIFFPESEDWRRVEVLAQGGSVRVLVDGQPVVPEQQPGGQQAPVGPFSLYVIAGGRIAVRDMRLRASR